MKIYTDEDLSSFLFKLDGSPTVDVTDWEAQFVESNLDRAAFSVKQREVVHRLIEKYGQRIGWA